MAIFGAGAAARSRGAGGGALGMIRELETLQDRWVAEGREPFKIGIGINTGDMMVGNLGSEQLFDYTVAGDGVNVGARVESLNKEYKTETCIIISEATYLAAQDALDVRRLGEATVKGRASIVVTSCAIRGRPSPFPRLINEPARPTSTRREGAAQTATTARLLVVAMTLGSGRGRRPRLRAAGPAQRRACA
jgi:adenylate cyclase